ncbi:MAG: VOC family protein [Gammaproteobacteria bacterium]
MPRVVRFDLGVDQPERAIKFYSGTFDWSIEKLPGVPDYWLITTGEVGEPGIDGGLVKRRHAADGTTCTIEVPSVDEALKKVTLHGGKNLTGKTTIPGVGYYAYCQDTEGNIFSMFESDQQAQ